MFKKMDFVYHISVKNTIGIVIENENSYHNVWVLWGGLRFASEHPAANLSLISSILREDNV